MKNLYYFLLFTFLTTSFSAQYVNYMDDTKWNLGFNTGGTWQEKEMVLINSDSVFTQPFTSIRGGFTVGKTVLMFPSSRLLALDLRFRYLRGINYGWTPVKDTVTIGQFPNTTVSAEVYKNYRMDLNEFSLEGVLTLQKLRERTGIIMYGFGGVGLVDYRIKADYLDGNLLYDYNNVSFDPNARKKAREIKKISDLDFETTIEGNQLKFMPSLGIGLGYQLTPSFSMGLEHKITYALHNNLDGFQDDLLNDKYHYTAIRMNFDILREDGSYNEEELDEEATEKENSTPKNPIPATGGTSNNGETPELDNSDNFQNSNGQPPIVNISNPSSSNLTVYGSNFHLNARVYNVNRKQQITFRHNGQTISSANYNFTSSLLTKQLELNPGLNTILISAVNNYGQDQDETIIIYNRKITGKPPVVDITNPATKISSTTNGNKTIKSYVLNVNTKDQITFKLNDVVVTGFDYNSQLKLVVANIQLKEGMNSVEITAKNNFGQDTQKRTINYKKAIPPKVQIINPSLDPFSTQNATIPIIATTNISNISKIKVFVNRHSTTFRFSPSTKEILFDASLIPGSNSISVEVENPYGEAEDNTIVIYKERQLGLPPNVTITSPSDNPHVSQQKNVTVLATINHVNNASNIELKFNNNPTTNFMFNSVTNELEVNLNLKDGRNKIHIKATNTHGNSDDEAVIEYKDIALLSPPIITYSFPSENVHVTTDKMILIQGQIEHVDQHTNAKAFINGLEARTFLFNAASQNFQCELQLQNGINTFNVQAFNPSGSANKSITIDYTPVECENPSIQLISPTSNTVTTSNSRGFIKAQIVNTQTVEFKIDGTPSQGYNFDVNTGEFTAMINLPQGTHTYEIKAFNMCGSVTELVTYNYGSNAGCPNPVINWVNPIFPQSNQPFITNNSQVLLSANILAIQKPNQCNIKLNGSPVGFNYNPITKELDAQLNCNTGKNTLDINIINQCGTINESRIITYTSAINPPVIAVNSHRNSSFETTKATENISGTVQNISRKKDIKVMLDGSPIDFKFDHINKKIQIQVELENGSNQLIIIASNSAGTKSKTIEIIKKGDPPVITIRQFNEKSFEDQPFIVNSPTQSIQGFVNHFDSSTEMEFYTLPAQKARLRYNTSNGVITGNLLLQKYKLTTLYIVITGDNGSSTKEIFFLYQPIIQASPTPTKSSSDEDTYYKEPENNSSSGNNNSNYKEPENNNTQKEEENDSNNNNSYKPVKDVNKENEPSPSPQPVKNNSSKSTKSSSSNKTSKSTKSSSSRTKSSSSNSNKSSKSIKR